MNASLGPISLIIITKDAAVFEAAKKQAGWVKAVKPNIATLARAAIAAGSNQQENTAPSPPIPETVSQTAMVSRNIRWVRPCENGTLRGYGAPVFLTKDDGFIFVGTASFDDGLDWVVLHHIDPIIDKDRDTLIAFLSV